MEPCSSSKNTKLNTVVERPLQELGLHRLKTWKKIFILGFDDWLIIGQMSDENPPRIEGSEATELPSCA